MIQRGTLIRAVAFAAAGGFTAGFFTMLALDARDVLAHRPSRLGPLAGPLMPLDAPRCLRDPFPGAN